MPIPIFPTPTTIATAFLDESIRHLYDARLLADGSNTRYAASIASTLKAIELSIKAVLILNNTAGIYDKVFTEHAILTSMESNVFLRGIITELESSGGNLLVSTVKEVEKLNPSSFADQFKTASEIATNPKSQRGGSKGLSENAEYPYFAAVEKDNKWTLEIRSPMVTVDGPRAADYFDTARMLLETVCKLYPDLAPNGITLPAPLGARSP